jgi:ATPase subunit of ABC transporter with duplicated ATPase domains
MSKAKLIEKIKEQLKAIVSNEVKFAEVKAGDLIITSPDEELVVGSEVYTVDQDGNNIPLSDGEFTLDSGVKIEVVNGKITSLETSEEPEAETEIEVEAAETEDKGEEKMPEEEVKEDEKEEPSKEEEMKKMLERLEKVEKMIEEMGKDKKAMEQKLSAISGEPAKKAISVEPAEFKSVEDKKESVGAVDVIAIREKLRKNR